MIAGRPGYHFTREPGFGFLLIWHKNNDGTLFSQPILLIINFYAMLIKTYGCALLGVEAIKVVVEVNLSKGHHQIISGLPDAAVKESLARLESAVHNSGFRMPASKITFNLGPADVKKSGSSFDLAMAVALLGATQQIHGVNQLHTFVLSGELGLSGSIEPVKGALSVAILAWKEGFAGVMVPFENAEEAALVTKIPVYGVRSLQEVAAFFNGHITLEPVKINTREQFYATQSEFDVDFADVKGQERVKRALEIAAAGGHNVILIGPPGSGKSMLANRLPTILPPLTLSEALETTRIYSVCGKMGSIRSRLVNKRPFRSPHSSSSHTSLVGGGSIPVPGEISLAHNGVLFLDEMPEFNRNVLEVLRQPLEDGKVSISRALHTVDFPAHFMLVASMNPCPCGYLNHERVACTCSTHVIQKYMAKISGPLLDRIDLHIDVKPLNVSELTQQPASEASSSVRERVITARELQTLRFDNHPLCHCNAHMNPALIKRYAPLTKDAGELLMSVMQTFTLSGRAHDRIIKVSRTIADLAGSEEIKFTHVSEAVGYRSLDRQSWIESAAAKNKSPKKSAVFPNRN